jgi:DnaJ-class molecular chaperone
VFDEETCVMGGPKLVLPREIIVCAFCGGKGTDPFNVLSDRSVCGVCQGRGTLEAPVPNARCPFCGGSGSHKTFRCPVCAGAGVVAPVAGPTRVCPDCAGSACETSSGLPCLTCHGHGVVRREAHEAKTA